MSDRRPPKAWPTDDQQGRDQGKPSNISVADRDDGPESPPRQADQAAAPADAATLGYADLAEHPPGPELAEFRDLRARLFGDIDIDFGDSDEQPPIDDGLTVDEQPAAPFIPAQASIANGALTAAEIAAADEEYDEDEPGELDADGSLREMASPAADVDVIHDEGVEAPPEAQPAEAVTAPAEAETAPVAARAPEAVPLQDSPSWTQGQEAPTAAVPDESSRHKGLILLALAAVVLTAIVGGWALLNRGGDGDGADRTAPAESPVAVASDESLSDSKAVVVIQGDSLRGTQEFTFDSTVSQVVLSLPQRPAGSAAADFDLEVTAVEISVPGQPTQEVAGELGSGDDITVALDHPSDRFAISYDAAGAVIQTEPSSAHRAKALVTPLWFATADGSRTLVTVNGANVLNLGCATGTEAMQACGGQTPEGWEVALTEPDTDVIAQVDLPQ